MNSEPSLENQILPENQKKKKPTNYDFATLFWNTMFQGTYVRNPPKEPSKRDKHRGKK